MSKVKVKPAGIVETTPWYFKKKKIFIAIILSCLFVYGNSLFNNYALDDEVVLLRNERVQKGISGIPLIFKSNYDISDKAKYEYRPLTLATFAIEYQFFKATPFISHFINLALYMLGCCLLFNILHKIFSARYGIWLPLFAVAIFIVHPIHTEVVNNIKCRDELLVFIFGLISWHIAYNFFTKGNYLNVLFFYIIGILGMLSKRNEVVWLASVPLLGYFVTEKFDWKKSLILFVMAVLCHINFNDFSQYLLGAPTSREHMFFENPLFYDHTLKSKIAMTLYCYAFYIKLLILPITLVFFYGYNTIPIPEFTNPLVLFSIAMCIGLLYYCIRNLKNKTAILFGIVFFTITILPFLNLIEPVAGIIAERFLFSPSVGFCVAVAATGMWYFKLSSNTKTFTNVPAGFRNSLFIILLILSFRTIARNSDWKNHLTLYSADIENIPESAKAHSLLAIEYRKQVIENKTLTPSQKQEYVKNALMHFHKAIEIYPDYITALNNLGAMYYSFIGDIPKAQPLFEKAIKLRPDYYEANYNLARCYENKKEYDKAIQTYLKCQKMQPETYMVYNDLIKLYLTAGQAGLAIKLNEYNLNKGLDDSFFYENIGNIYVTIKDTSKAIPYYKNVLKLKPERYEIANFVNSYESSHVKK